MSRANKSMQTEPRRVLDRLAQVAEEFDGLVAKIDRVSLMVDDVKQTLGELAEQKPELNALLQPVKGKSRTKKAETRPPVRYAASVELTWGLESAEVLIDGQKLLLSPTLGRLLEILLADDSSASASSRDGWKTREELALRLGKRTGSLVTKHALENQNLARIASCEHCPASLQGPGLR